TATLLPNGLVLVAGGKTATGDDTATSELYNPATGQFTITAPMNWVRSSAFTPMSAILLPNGTVLVAGGYRAGATAELYDPIMSRWTSTGSLATHSAPENSSVLLPTNNRVLIHGRFISSVSSSLYDSHTASLPW